MDLTREKKGLRKSLLGLLVDMQVCCLDHLTKGGRVVRHKYPYKVDFSKVANLLSCYLELVCLGKVRKDCNLEVL